MRVLMLTWEFPPRYSGGTAAHVQGLSQALADAGHDVFVLTSADRRADHEAERTGPVRVLRAEVGLPHIPVERYLALVASAGHALTQLALDAHSPLAGWTPDVVHGHDWKVGWAADTLSRHYDVPFVLTMHGTEKVRHGGNLPLGEPTDVNSIEWWLAFRADRLIASTSFMVDQLVTGFELAPEHVVRIPNGINPSLWGGHDRPSEREPLIVSWGRVQYEKGFQVLARSMTRLRAQVPGVSCVIAGRGSYLPELQTQIDVEGVSDLIELPGFLSGTDLRQLVHRAGCVVIPSLYEPFGLVALEALAAGAPLIVARTGGLAELIVDTGAGLTFEPGNPDDLAETIEMVLQDRDLALELTRQARRLIETKYAWDAVATTVVDVYAACRNRRLS
ncbi:glycosyltransferase family 4 protein [Ilumatobacter sp.]|uniref:glycosyltransferase family 4 protein n=1 Tax=Ilumatobacter sp. TaxID=1967498 RepID=UPI003C32E287